MIWDERQCFVMIKEKACVSVCVQICGAHLREIKPADARGSNTRS